MEKVHVGATQKILKIIGSYFGNSRLRQAIGQVKATETSHKWMLAALRLMLFCWFWENSY